MTDDTIPARPVAGDAGDLSISPFGVANFILRRRRVLLACVGIGAVGGLVWALATRPIYQAEVLFVTSPGAGRSAGGVLADLGPIQQRDPIDYYTSVLGSSAVAESVLETKDAGGRTVRERLRIPANSPAHDARELLKGALVQLLPSARARSGQTVPVIAIRARWTDAQTASDLANAYYDALAEYDHKIRTAAARERGAFLGKRVDETSDRLKDAENALRTFKEQNRLLTAAGTSATGNQAAVPPQLEERRAQLQREVDLQSDQYLSLKKALDQAAIAEQDDGSAMVLVETASPPRIPTGGMRRQIVWFGTALGLMFGLGLAGFLEIGQRADFTSPDGQEFLGHLNDIRRQVRDALTRATRSLSPPVDPPESHPK